MTRKMHAHKSQPRKIKVKEKHIMKKDQTSTAKIRNRPKHKANFRKRVHN